MIGFERYKDPKEALGFDKKEVIKNWLDSNGITNYFITRNFMVDVYSKTDLSGKGLTELPVYIQFRKIEGSFSVAHNNLTSLRGCPHRTKASFYCCDNQLASLEFGPIQVVGSYIAQNNNLTSLQYLPEKINSFSCAGNLLKTLKYIPEIITGDLYCYDNNLISITELPKIIHGDLYINFSKYKKFTIDQIRNQCRVEGTIHII